MKNHLIKPILFCFTITLLSFIFLIHSVYAWSLLFADNPQTSGDQTGYVMGTAPDQIILYQSNPKVIVLQTDFAGTGKDVFAFKTGSLNHIELAHTLPEFIGMQGDGDRKGSFYVDALMRLALGQSNYTLNQLKLLFRCQWQKADGTITSGDIAAYEADATKTGVVAFTGGVEIMGR